MAWLIYFLVITVCQELAQSINLCGDWYQYKDSKCFKVVEKTVTEEEAVKECLGLDAKASLLSIHSKPEQQYVNDLVDKYNTISDRVWLGLKYTNGSYRWTDGTPLDFTDWADDAVKDGSEPCVQLSSVKPTLGKWTDELCKRTALIVCQKGQELNLNVLRFAVENLTQVFENEMNSLKNQSSVPIGFIYTQLPKQSDPTDLWPNTNWNDVTEEYSGLFFRAEGDGSAQFGQTQQADQARISEVSGEAYQNG